MSLAILLTADAANIAEAADAVSLHVIVFRLSNACMHVLFYDLPDCKYAATTAAVAAFSIDIVIVPRSRPLNSD